MRYMKIKRVITLVILVTVVGVAGFARTGNSPSNEAIDVAQQTSNLTVNELVAALFEEFNETTLLAWTSVLRIRLPFPGYRSGRLRPMARAFSAR